MFIVTAISFKFLKIPTFMIHTIYSGRISGKSQALYIQRWK